jgi:uncharacterized protein
MLIRIDDIKEGGIYLECSESPEGFPLLKEMVESGELTILAPISLRMKIYRIQEMVEVEGQAETRLSFTCGGCLKEFEAPLSSSFAVTFVRELPQVSDEADEEVQLSAEEMGMIPFQGEEIDLHPVVGEQIVMALPIRPLCREVCKGLCPQCGGDLNEADCGCVRPAMNNKFAALKGFRVDKE